MKFRWRWLVAAALIGLMALLYAALWSSPTPAAGAFKIDLAAARAMVAQAMGPVEIRAIKVAEAAVPAGATIAGRSLFTKEPLVIVAYQLVYADGSTVMIDSAHNMELHQKNFAPDGAGFDQDAFDRMQQALRAAKLILVTHEHLDHLGGIAQSPYLAELAPKVWLTRAQLDGPTLPHVQFKAADLKLFTPVDLNGPTSPAPGVVVIPAPGHSTGTQLIYVRRSDGREYLFVGDIAWHADAIRLTTGRPYVVSQYMLREDRQAVADQLLALQPLLAAGEVTLIVAHDDAQFRELLKQGLVVEGLQLP
jgi:glyoxylase-like metal-dependent hydrolase (beta-lactamase superfamily II)